MLYKENKMAEKLKVFVNKTFTNQDINPDGTITLIQNDATTQAVVKSFEVEDRSLDNKLKYRVENDGFIIAEDLAGMEGSEIVDKGKLLRLNTDALFNNNLFLDYTEPSEELVFPAGNTVTISSLTSAILSETSGATINCAYINDIGDALYLPVSSDYKDFSTLKAKYPYVVSPVVHSFGTTTNYTTPIMYSPAWFRIVGNNAYHFNWDGNSTAQLLKAPISGGVVGAWANVHAGSYAFKAVDVENNIVYWVDSTALYKYDLATQVQSTVGGISGVPAAVSSFSTATFCNGVFFYIVSSSYQGAIYYWNSATNQSGTINVNTAFALSSYSRIAVAYNQLEDKWYIDVGYSTTSYIYTITGSITGTKTATYIGNQALLPFTLNSAQGIVVGDKNGRMLYKCTASTGGVQAGWAVVKWEGNKAILVENTAATFTVLYQNPMYIGSGLSRTTTITTYEVTPAAQTVRLDINEDTIPFSAKLKISGVEITEEI